MEITGQAHSNNLDDNNCKFWYSSSSQNFDGETNINDDTSNETSEDISEMDIELLPPTNITMMRGNSFRKYVLSSSSVSANIDSGTFYTSTIRKHKDQKKI